MDYSGELIKSHQLGWHHKIEVDEGIHRLYEWYLKEGAKVD